MLSLAVLSQSPCCDKVYPCRLCHNEKEPTHEIDRYKVSEVVCRKCHQRQPVSSVLIYTSCTIKLENRLAYYLCCKACVCVQIQRFTFSKQSGCVCGCVVCACFSRVHVCTYTVVLHEPHDSIYM